MLPRNRLRGLTRRAKLLKELRKGVPRPPTGTKATNTIDSFLKLIRTEFQSIQRDFISTHTNRRRFKFDIIKLLPKPFYKLLRAFDRIHLWPISDAAAELLINEIIDVYVK